MTVIVYNTHYFNSTELLNVVSIELNNGMYTVKRIEGDGTTVTHTYNAGSHNLTIL